MSFDIAIDMRRAGRRIGTTFATDGGITALCGPSGVGKSSVLAVIAGLLRPDHGHVVVGGQVLFDAARGVSLPPEQRACGMVFQDLRLFPHLSVEANLRYGERRANPARGVLDFAETVRFLDIAPLLRRRPATLSGGEAQRVAIGRALLSGPRFLLLDEPLAALDGALRDEIMTVIERVRDRFALPMILVSHSAAEVDRLADQVVELTSA
ncbi:ATP-binding cassette domain-containing protein [Novosphingobium sp. FSW06-99]|uniref:ATP-binding cassette domain-containing protein n=1 Tax=Novosphingobium sp. FSW06-99 TaxID=1739113 RepID=UPI00076D1061|nr:ATP-binding cassette domain-containing protein [Novosphingobium sp. FSW06-99]KUR75389.1 molybdenum ABC transporter ATP-binding protein [Novosphingobium sp. FSW06-99]